jgi:hypothetical protein
MTPARAVYASKPIYAPRDLRQREAVIAAGLALSVFWDPVI